MESNTFSYTAFIPLEVKSSYRRQFYADDGTPKYVVEVDPDTKRYIRHTVRLITDPSWYARLAYVLYDAKEVEYVNWQNVAGYLIDKVDFVTPDRVIL